MSQGNFPFIGSTKTPEAAPALIMRHIESEAEAVAYSIRKSGLKLCFIAECMNVSEGLVSFWITGVRTITDKRLTRFCEITGSFALKQFRQRAAKEAAVFDTETTAQKMQRLIAMEQAA